MRPNGRADGGGLSTYTIPALSGNGAVGLFFATIVASGRKAMPWGLSLRSYITLLLPRIEERLGSEESGMLRGIA